MTEFEIREESIETLAQHANISIAFEYDHILELTIADNGLGGFAFVERHLAVSQRKDYDAIEGEGPGHWCSRFDVSSWGLIVARFDGHRIGGAVMAYSAAGVDMLKGRGDLAVLWDIRVDPVFRGQGVGPLLFQAAEIWSAQRGCTQLKIETQNTNIAACKFYARQGCTLGAINRFAYPNLPNEVQLLWYKYLRLPGNSSR
jgi:ribosomal protein S18 acetylase RimI-like enzyme